MGTLLDQVTDVGCDHGHKLGKSRDSSGLLDTRPQFSYYIAVRIRLGKLVYNL